MIIFIVVIALMAGIAAIKNEPIPSQVYSVFIILAVVVIIFSSLTVTVDDKFVSAAFGLGFIRRRIRLENIESYHKVRNSFWQGFGIRLIKGGVMFNVAGMDAVELKLKDGGVFRFGTDEPAKLMLAIEQALAGRGQSD